MKYTFFSLFEDTCSELVPAGGLAVQLGELGAHICRYLLPKVGIYFEFDILQTVQTCAAVPGCEDRVAKTN